MRLKFGLLWIEDNYSEQEEKELIDSAALAGFELEITNSRDGSDIEQLAEYQHRFHLFDLVLLDLKLSGGVKGDELAPKVRKLFRTTPILFYSGSDSEDGLRQRMAADKIEGVFCASRERFTACAGEMIQDYAHSLNRLSGMRGLAMEVVAEVDTACQSIIMHIASQGHEEHAVKFLDQAVQEQSAKNANDFPLLETLEHRLKHPAADSTKTFKLFRELVRKYTSTLPNGDRKDQLRALRDQTRRYSDNVIQVRNVLGHALEEKTDRGWQILDRDGNVYMTVADFPDYRKNFLSNLHAVREIRRILID